MSSSPSTKQKSPKRTTPGRSPLQERSQSQANELSGILARDGRVDQENLTVYNSTPFPTKAAHFLLPSTLRNQRSGASPLTDAFGLAFQSDPATSNEGDRTPRSGSAQPTVRLKRSVKALRDLYESQGEDNSRPSTATSPPLRPSTANSSRLRSVSSNDSLSGPYAWESLRKISSDDLALLPSLPQSSRFVKRLSSRSSFTSVSEKFAAASSPNYRVLGATSSPRPLAFKDITSPALEPFDEIESTDSIEGSSSSPNVVRLARTSSTEQFQSTDSSSSPNVIKLGTSSPTMRVRAPDFVSHSRSSSTSSRKRKRSDTLDSRSFAERAGARNPLASSPPISRYATSVTVAQSSPAERNTPSSSGPQSFHLRGRSVDESSPIVHVLARNHPNSDDSSVAETHTSLQGILSSSPPRIQYPIIRAPLITQQVGLIVPKRNSRSMSTDASAPKFSLRLSAVPSEGSWTRTRRGSRASFEEDDIDDIDDLLTSDDLAPASTFIINESANQSMIRVVPGSDLHDLDSHEASDEVSALPYDYDYRSPPLRPVRSGGYLNSSANSSLSRINAMRPSTQSRQNSFLSTSLRPSSSSSVASNIVPTWAKRYYSGFYRDSFNYLYSNGSHLNLNNMPSQKANPIRPNSSKSQQSTAPVHQGMTERIQAFFTPKKRPRLEARKSHTLPGTGPLVSNPIRGPATAAIASNRVQSYPAARRSSNHGRSISAPLHPADPRAHWAGVVEIHSTIHEDGLGSEYTIRQHHIRTGSNGDLSLSSSQSVIHRHGRRQSRWSGSPHLHHDHRLNTGSSVSLGFGYPFNAKAKWSAPSITDTTSNIFGSPDLRTAQVVLFTTGFLLPLLWFVAAFLPLPKRPEGLGDLEKRAAASAQYQAQLLQQQRSSRLSVQQLHQQQLDVAEWEQMDIVAKLRLERHAQGVEELKFQNARWWRNLNRCMCAIGLVVIAVVIVLAVLGAKGAW
ncbi:hypothetical protein LTR84_012183 [Exophiala bonariae]|uniref:Serine-rich protein n=1 Tax=Exophiala bonariae TaxID=1690606 RepID=A0AAV9NJ57_9EURO|nr:hypothetical protein LTR84_012183 [Exophiala bonariae]